MLLQLFITFAKIGLFSFGGGYAMIPLIEKEVVRIHQWLTLPQMVDIIAVAEMTPGPVAVNIATFVGYKTAGFWGAFVATFGVIFPSFLIVLMIARTYSKFKEMEVFQRILKGIRPMVVALIGSAAYVIAQMAIIDIKSFFIALISLGIFLFTKISPLVVILAAGLCGIILFAL
ncbi:MAG: chromate transporter [Bacillota bacterium]|jgi:chromate transporter